MGLINRDIGVFVLSVFLWVVHEEGKASNFISRHQKQEEGLATKIFQQTQSSPPTGHNLIFVRQGTFSWESDDEHR